MLRFEVLRIKIYGEIGHHKPLTCTSLTQHSLTLTGVVIQKKILYKSGTKTGNSLKRYSIPPDCLRNIVLKLKVDCMKTQGEIAVYLEKLKLERTKANSIYLGIAGQCAQ